MKLKLTRRIVPCRFKKYEHEISPNKPFNCKDCSLYKPKTPSLFPILTPSYYMTIASEISAND